ncbi:MAG: response regulator [Pseudomonadales bacterium]
MSKKNILVIEDDADISSLLRFSLENTGFSVFESPSAEAGIQILADQQPDLVIIDWMLPGMDGISLTKALRKREDTKQIPIIMLTARSEEADAIRGFDSGVDDYITKPFSPRELIARVNALLRRTNDATENLIKSNGMALNPLDHTLQIRDERLYLKPREFSLLEHLMGNPNRIFSRTQLLDNAWGRSVYVEERTVDVYILRLRKKLEPFGKSSVITTVHGVGYIYKTTSGE